MHTADDNIAVTEHLTGAPGESITLEDRSRWYSRLIHYHCDEEIQDEDDEDGAVGVFANTYDEWDGDLITRENCGRYFQLEEWNHDSYQYRYTWHNLQQLRSGLNNISEDCYVVAVIDLETGEKIRWDTRVLFPDID